MFDLSSLITGNSFSIVKYISYIMMYKEHFLMFKPNCTSLIIDDKCPAKKKNWNII